MAEKYPEWDIDFREEKADLTMEFNEAMKGYDDAVVMAVLEELLARRVNKRARWEYKQRWKDGE